MDDNRSSYRKDGLGALLKSMESLPNPSDDVSSSSSPQDQGAPRSAAPVPQQAPTGAPSVGDVLGYLRKKGNSSLPDLAAGLQSPILQTAQVLETLQSSGLVKMQGEAGRELIMLTQAGKTLSTIT